MHMLTVMIVGLAMGTTVSIANAVGAGNRKFAGIHFCFSGYFCAMGKSELSFVHNILAVVLVRIPGAYLCAKRFPQTLFPMGLATVFGSVLSVLICLVAYFALKKRKNASKTT